MAQKRAPWRRAPATAWRRVTEMLAIEGRRLLQQELPTGVLRQPKMNSPKTYCGRGLKMATKRQNERRHNPPAVEECDHYWIIEGAVGPVSKGVCNLCGVQKEFKNYLTDCLPESSQEYRKLLSGHGDDKEVEPGQEDTLARVSRLYYTTVRPSRKGFPESKLHSFSRV